MAIILLMSKIWHLYLMPNIKNPHYLDTAVSSIYGSCSFF